MTSVAEPIEAQSLMKSVHETGDLQSIVAAYIAMERLRSGWRSTSGLDRSVFVLGEPEAASFGKGQDISFDWGFGPITIKASVNTSLLSINAGVGVKIPFLGYKELAGISGDLSKGVSAEIDAFAVKGKVTFFLRNGKELFVKLELSSPFFSAISQEFKILSLCKMKFRRV